MLPFLYLKASRGNVVQLKFIFVVTMLLFITTFVPMKISFRLRHKTNPATIYIRLSAGRNIQSICSTNININPSHWSYATNKILPSKETPGASNTKLSKLKAYVEEQFNADYTKMLITTDWLRAVVSKFNNKVPKGVPDHKAFLYDFLVHNHCTPARLKRFQEYDGKDKLLIKDIGYLFSESYGKWLLNKKELLPESTNQELAYLKTFIKKAGKEGLEVTNDMWWRKKVKQSIKMKLKPVALTQKEVDLIYKHDFLANRKLHNAQTLLILGFYTGARISDLHKINAANIVSITDNSGGAPVTFEAFSYTQEKTGKRMIVPVHPRVKEYLTRDHHFLNRSTFGIYFKDIGKEVGLTRKVYGRSYRKETKEGEFELHELLSTHVMRRTFASLNWGKIPTPMLLQLTGHEKAEMLMKYIGVADDMGAKALNKLWTND